MKTKSVSLVVPILARRWLHGFFASLLDDGLRDWDAAVEVVIIDNSPSDAALSFGNQLQTKVVYHDPPVSFHAGWNEGMRLATGDVVIVVNDDVIWGRRCVLNLVDALETFDLICCYPTPACGPEGLPDLFPSKVYDRPRLVGPPEFRGWCHAWFAARFPEWGLGGLGGDLFDERYELFYGDDDAWMQTICAGSPARQVHNAVAHHLESQSVKTLPDDYVKNVKARDAARFREKWKGKTPRELLVERGLDRA